MFGILDANNINVVMPSENESVHRLFTRNSKRRGEGGGGCESAGTRIVRDPGAVLHFPRSQGSQTSLLACVAHWSYT